VEWAQCITIKVPCFFFSLRKSKEGKVIERFHGVDRHKKFSTISVVNREGQEIQFLSACWDLRSYIQDLGPEDAVILEASSGAFWWADRIEAKGASCTILDPHRFRIIKDSWKKTDKSDARNMVKALWVHWRPVCLGFLRCTSPQGSPETQEAVQPV
jgi:transposase